MVSIQRWRAISTTPYRIHSTIIGSELLLMPAVLFTWWQRCVTVMSQVRNDLVYRFDIVHFLEEYQKYPCLWKKSDPNFKNRLLRDSAEQSLLHTFNFASTKELKQKIRSIRGTYNQERNKVRNSVLSGVDIYRPKLIWFDIADSFLRQNDNENENESFLVSIYNYIL